MFLFGGRQGHYAHRLKFRFRACWQVLASGWHWAHRAIIEEVFIALKGVRKVFVACSTGRSQTFRTPFLRLRPPRSSWSTPPAPPAAAMRDNNSDVHSMPNTLPALRFAGAPGLITSGTAGRGPTPLCSGAAPVRQPGDAHPDPGRRDHRTHVADATAGCSAAASTAARQGRVYSTQRCIILTHSQLQIWRQPQATQCTMPADPVVSRGLRCAACRKTASPGRNRVEMTTHCQRVDHAHLNKSTK